MYKILLSIVSVCVCAICFSAFSKEPEITVLMSTYNRSSFLPASIESILGQTFSDFEFIIINDGSDDQSDDILKSYAAKDKRIKVVTNEKNEGLVYSLNWGLNLARGKYIARMDDDDVALPERFEKQHAFMEGNPDVAVVASWVGVPDGSRAWTFQQETDPQKIKVQLYLNSVPISHPASFLRRHFLEKHHIRYNNAYRSAEDRKMWLDILDAGGTIRNIPEVLLLFRLHGTNPIQYYREQRKNTNKFFQEEILTRFGIVEDLSDLTECEIRRKMILKNETLNILPQKELLEMIEKKCPNVVGEKVIHPYWKDFFVFDGERVCRYELSSECGKILKRDYNSLSIKWDRWGTEIFEKKKGVWILK